MLLLRAARGGGLRRRAAPCATLLAGDYPPHQAASAVVRWFSEHSSSGGSVVVETRGIRPAGAHLGEAQAAADATADAALGDLLKPLPASVLPEFNARARCHVAYHEREKSWQERSAPLQRALVAAGQSTPPLFMVVVIKGKQYKVTMGDTLAAEIGLDVDINEYLSFDSVLMVGHKDWTVVGTPHVPTARVVVQCEEITKAAKVWVFKKKRRKGYARNQGHRHRYTVLRVVGMDFELGDVLSSTDDE